MSGPSESLLLGLFKTTVVHRHAFISSLTATKEIGCDARLPASFMPATRLELAPGIEGLLGQGLWSEARRRLGKSKEPSVLLGVLRLFAPAGPRPPSGRLEAMIERYACLKGVRELERLTRQRPEHWPSFVWLGLALLRRNEFVAARRCFDALVRLRPDWVWSYVLRSEVGRADIDFAAAMKDLDRAAAMDPANAWVYALRSRVHFQKSTEPGAIEDLNRAVALDPGAGWMRAWRGDARRKLADAKGALQDLLQAKALEPSYDRTYLWLGKVFDSLGLHERALAVLDEGRARCPAFGLYAEEPGAPGRRNREKL